MIDLIPVFSTSLNSGSLSRRFVWYWFRRPGRNPPPRYETFWRRFFALLVDLIVLYPMSIARSHIDYSPWAGNKAFGISVLLLQAGIVLTYRVAMHARLGQTVGKIACRVKVVDAVSGGPITFRQALLREGARWIFAFLVTVWWICNIASGETTLENNSYMDPMEPSRWIVYGLAIASSGPTPWFASRTINTAHYTTSSRAHSP